LAKQFREFCQNAKMPKRTQRGENEIKQAAWSRFSLAVARFKHELSKNWNRGILVSVLLLCGLRGGRRRPGNEKPGAVSRPGGYSSVRYPFVLESGFRVNGFLADMVDVVRSNIVTRTRGEEAGQARGIGNTGFADAKRSGRMT
jgi:hypothetical protein